MSKSKPVVVVNRGSDGVERAFVPLIGVMSPMIASIDSVPVTFFEGVKTAYLQLENAIEWVEKECRTNKKWATKERGVSGTQLLIALRLLKEKFETGQLVDPEESVTKVKSASLKSKGTVDPN